MTQTPDTTGTPPEEQPAHQYITSVSSEQARLGRLSMEVSLALNRRETLREMLTACTEALVRYLDAAFARIWIFNEEEGVLELQASSGMYTHLNGQHSHVPLGTLKIGLIAAERKPHLTNAVIGDPRIGDQEWARREGMVAFAGYPLLVDERLVGVVAIFARHQLNDATLQAMAVIANGIALGIERLHMQEERVRLLVRERTARIEAETAHRHLHDLFMQAPAIICVLRGKEHVFEIANPGYLQLVDQRELIGKPVRETLPENEAQALIEVLNQVYTTGEPFIGKEVRVEIDRYHNGILEEGYFNFVYQPTRNAEDEVDGIMLHAVDVTEQVQARDHLQRSQVRLTLAQQAGRIGTFEWDISANRILWTPELEALYGLPPGGFEGSYQNWARRVHPDDVQQAEENLRVAVNGGPSYNVEFRVIWPNGTVRWLLAKGDVSLYDAQQRPLRMIGVNIDITERKQSEQALAAMVQNVQDLNATLEARVIQRTEALSQLNTELQRSNQELQDFAYVASHDLQEPLRKIQAFSNLLVEEYGSVLGDGKAYLDRMRNAATRMRTLIEDLLTFSRVTTKAEPFSRVDLNAVVRQVVDDLEPRLHSTGGSITVDDLPTIDADARQMYQMFQNLMTNAIKFHRAGVAPNVRVFAEIRTPLQEEVSSPPEQQCVFFVADNGIGFDEKYLDRIFTVFQRLHGRDEYEGTGIGLAVVRKIAERHGGTVTARSIVGEGTTFMVTLPVAQQTLAEREMV